MQDAVGEFGRRVANHRKVLKVEAGRFNESLAIGPFNWRKPTLTDRFCTLLKTADHVVGIKGSSHGAMLWVGAGKGEVRMTLRN